MRDVKFLAKSNLAIAICGPLLVFGHLAVPWALLLNTLPSFKHWLTLGSVYYGFGFAFWVAISLVGVAVMNWPRKYLWALIFGGLVAVSLGFWDRAKSAQETADFRANVTGGDNYAYFKVEAKIAPNGENFLTVTTTGPMPIFDCSIRTLSALGKVSNSREWPIRPLPKSNARFSYTTLPPGRYRADCVMGEKSWQQHLEFSRTPGGIDQIFWVEKDNRIVKEGP
jgi:hypothetical protein